MSHLKFTRKSQCNGRYWQRGKGRRWIKKEYWNKTAFAQYMLAKGMKPSYV